MRWRLTPGIEFSVRFFGCLLLLSVLFWVFSVHEHLGPLQRTIAALSAGISRWTGGRASVEGDEIVVETMRMTVNHECTGIFVWMLFASFVIAYPATWWARVTGLAIGIPLFCVINVVRLATLARIVEIYPSAFFYLHEYVWQGMFTVLVLVGALAWAEQLD